MNLRKLATTAVAAISIGAASMSANAALDGPYYQCAETDLSVFEGSVVDAAVATPELSTLVTAVTAAGLADTLATTDGFTVYAPTD